jgi:hypothetical protein
MQLTGPRATILAAVIAVIGIAIGAFLNPLANKLVNKPAPISDPTTLAIEQIPQQIFAYAGNNNPDGGWSAFWLYYEDEGNPVYKLEYALPEDKNGYAGLAFEFNDGANLSAYQAVECTLIFNQPSDVVDLYFKDIAGNFNTVRVANNNTNEMTVRYEFTNYPEVNFNAVNEFGLVVSTDFSTGSHHVRIKDVRFVK